MKQIVQHLGSGKTILEEVPSPLLKPGHVLIKTRKSLVSTGTERMLVGFGKGNIFQKVIQQPEKARMVMDKIRSEGLVPTLKAVRNKLDQAIPLGYCNVGEVIALGDGITDLRVGDRVVSNGPHAEIVCVSRNLVAPIPENVNDNDAAFTVPGAIALQSIRLMNPLLGETIVVIGLGLIGLLTAQLLRINGCGVVGMDTDEGQLEIARSKGITVFNCGEGDVKRYIDEFTNGIGADGVIVAASTGGNVAISQAVEMCRQQGKIVLIGAVGLEIPHPVSYKKELTFQVSRSYGPGRYDTDYEEKNNDYPIEYVRWTVNRHFQVILQLLSSTALDVSNPSTQITALADFGQVYQDISRSKAITIFEYPDKTERVNTVRYHSRSFAGRKGVVGTIGAGNFSAQTLLPQIEKTAVKYIASAKGLSGATLAKKYGIPFTTTDFNEILDDQEVDLIIIATRHDLHAPMAVAALKAGKHVFVEKPLAIFGHDLDAIIGTYMKSAYPAVSISVGFNRRFAPHALRMKSLLGDALMNVSVTVNAGLVDSDSWIHDRDIGGGRVIGEACHFLDFISFLTGSVIVSICANAMGVSVSETTDNVCMLLKYENGSTGVVSYLSNGSGAYPKERVEVHSQGRTLVLDNFKTLHGYGFKGFSKMRTQQDKGHKAQFARLLESVRSGGDPIISLKEIVNATRASFGAVESLKTGVWVKL